MRHHETIEGESASPFPALPEAELRLIESAIGGRCRSVGLYLQRDADLEYLFPQPSGLFEVTFGVLLDLEPNRPLCLTWTQDRLGNPYRLIGREDMDPVYSGIVNFQDVSLLPPWSSILGEPCQGIRPYTYPSNHGRNTGPDIWHDVLWGLARISHRRQQ